MVLPEVIPRQSNPVVASYDFIDIADGLGYQDFYGCAFSSTTGSNGSYQLIDSNNIYSDTTATGVPFTLNFDTNLFNLPRTVKGNIQIQTPITADTSGRIITYTYQLKKVLLDGTTTENISASFQYQTTGSTNYIPLITIALTKTIIKKGERLRLTITGAVNAGSSSIYHDPIGRTGVGHSTTSVMKVRIPFRVDN